MKFNNGILKEIHHSNDKEFQFSSYSFNSLYDYAKVPNHLHEELEIIYFKNGKALYEIDFNKYLVEGESIIIIRKNMVHGVEPNRMAQGEGNIFIFNTSLMEGASFDFVSSKYINPIINEEAQIPKIISLKENPESFNYLKTILEEISYIWVEKKVAYELKIKNRVLEFFAHLYELNFIKINNVSEKEKQKQIKIERVFYYIHENYKKKISLEDTSKILELSPAYFGKFFKEYTGQNFIDYLNNYRLAQGAQLILNTDMSITEICYEVGFENLSYFINSFKKHFKETPGKYRRT